MDSGDALVPTLAELGVILLLLLRAQYSGDGSFKRLSAGLVGVIDLIANSVPGHSSVSPWVGHSRCVGPRRRHHISSSGIVAQVIRDLRWRRNPETKPVVSVLVLEDLVMAPYLLILAVVLTGTGLLTGFSASRWRSSCCGRHHHHVEGGTGWRSSTRAAGRLAADCLRRSRCCCRAGGTCPPPAVAAFLVGLLLTGELRKSPAVASILFVNFSPPSSSSTSASTDISNLPAVLPAAGLALLTIGTKFVTGWFAAATGGRTISRLRAGAS